METCHVYFVDIHIARVDGKQYPIAIFIPPLFFLFFFIFSLGWGNHEPILGVQSDELSRVDLLHRFETSRFDLEKCI